MKYVNSLKYMNSFEVAESHADISFMRTLELCDALGRVNVGNRAIYLPSGTFGYAAAVMLESVIRNAGYRVGRITSAFGSDSRNIVYIDGDRASIDDYNLAVAEIKAAVLRSQDKIYLKEEVMYAMSLLICKMNSCDYVILQGMSDTEHDLASLCAPYDLVIAPTLGEQDITSESLCNAIKRGVREVISGTQRKNVYDLISKACFACGARLTFSSRSSFYTEAVSSIERRFHYGERSGYTVKSPSVTVSECAMLVVESALAIRRSGVKLPWASISDGLASASGMGCFEIVSAAPLILLDSSENEDELAMFLSTVEEVFDTGKLCGMAVCLPSKAAGFFEGLKKYEPSMLIAVGESTQDTNDDGIVFAKDMKAASRLVLKNMRQGIDTLCFGSVGFEAELSHEIMRSMDP